jgi:maltose O-acetyltransferase
MRPDSRLAEPHVTPSERISEPPQKRAFHVGRALSALVDELRGLRPGPQLIQGLNNHLLPHFCFNRLRTALWRSVKLDIGAGSLVMGPLLLSGTGDWQSLLSVGAETYISGPLRIDLGGAVKIGNRVNIGHDCLLLTVEHEFAGSSRRAGPTSHKSITIHDGVWLASRVVVLPGVTIGSGSVVAAGAVVATDVAPNTLVGGVPAKVLRQLSI